MPTILRGEHSSLPVWLTKRQLVAKQQKMAAELVLETGEEAPNKTFGRAAGDEQAMRGADPWRWRRRCDCGYSAGHAVRGASAG
jgi:hypothetical protein